MSLVHATVAVAVVGGFPIAVFVPSFDLVFGFVGVFGLLLEHRFLYPRFLTVAGRWIVTVYGSVVI
ncbi:hypothetical protein [Halomicrococcus gelatinilyticus]|uniref:hypothetical protein n=1 Tax=Halomicrococcus gelatinilyticus TaxID=1702103 RepID=UPI002E13812C